MAIAAGFAALLIGLLILSLVARTRTRRRSSAPGYVSQRWLSALRRATDDAERDG